jgi:hypothetical protein
MQATDPLNVWLVGGLTLDDKGQPVDPLKRWIQHGRAGNTHGGLLQMALDVLSFPGMCFCSVLFFFFFGLILTVGV